MDLGLSIMSLSLSLSLQAEAVASLMRRVRSTKILLMANFQAHSLKPEHHQYRKENALWNLNKTLTFIATSMGHFYPHAGQRNKWELLRMVKDKKQSMASSEFQFQQLRYGAGGYLGGWLYFFPVCANV